MAYCKFRICLPHIDKDTESHTLVFRVRSGDDLFQLVVRRVAVLGHRFVQPDRCEGDGHPDSETEGQVLHGEALPLVIWWSGR